MADDEAETARHRAGAREWLMSRTRQPAVLLDRHLRVQAANPLAQALSPGFREGVNLARFTFLGTLEVQDRACWRDAAGRVTALLRDSLDQHESDQEYLTLVGELSARSAAFSRAWADDAPAAVRGSITFPGTAVGALALDYRLTRRPDDYEHTLLLLEPADGAALDALQRLAVLVREAPPDEDER